MVPKITMAVIRFSGRQIFGSFGPRLLGWKKGEVALSPALPLFGRDAFGQQVIHGQLIVINAAIFTTTPQHFRR